MKEIYEPMRIQFNEPDYFTIDFLDHVEFLDFVQEIEERSPIFQMKGNMTDRFGMQKYNEGTLNRVLYCLAFGRMLIRYFDLKEEGDPKYVKEE